MQFIVSFCFLICFLLRPAFAEDVGIGALASNLIEPVEVVYSFLASASIIIGVMCLFASIIRYNQFRTNPLANPISTVIVLFVLGVVLVLLPFVYKLTESGIPYAFFS